MVERSHCGFLFGRRFARPSEADLAENSSGFAGWIVGSGNWASHHDVTGAGGNGLGGRDHPGLIVGGRARRAYSWSHDGKVSFELASQRGGFLGGSDNALASVGNGERRQAQYLILYPAVHA